MSEPQPQGAPFRILLVCTGNTCRSPMAEAIGRMEIERRGWRDVEISSAGIAAHPGAPPAWQARQVAEEHGTSLEGHRSRRADAVPLDDADLVLAMGPSHLAALWDHFPADRVHLLGAFGGVPAGERGVPDPFGGGVALYRRTWRELERLISAALDRLPPIVAP